MSKESGRVSHFSHFIHAHFLWFLLGCYAVASFVPQPGLALRKVNCGTIHAFHESVPLSLPTIMLALLLFNAGLGINLSRLKSLVRNPVILLLGLAANLVVPLLFILGVSQGMRIWPDHDEVQSILVGLALIASMPVAGSSTAWSQNADGDMALSLGLVLFSTILSPLTTPAVLHSVEWMASGVYSERLHELASSGTSLFLTVNVLVPSLAGILLNALIGEKNLARSKPLVKAINSVNLLVLLYSNASVALPDVVQNPDFDFLAVMFVIVTALCATAFFTGWVLSHKLSIDRSRRTALMYGLGMNNNGTGMVLAATALKSFPAVMLPIIFYNLVQHIVAGAVSSLMHEADQDETIPSIPGIAPVASKA